MIPGWWCRTLEGALVFTRPLCGLGATSEQRIEKAAREMKLLGGTERAAHFICAISLVRRNRALAVLPARQNGEILLTRRGNGGFGYDPVFFFPSLKRSFAELTGRRKKSTQPSREGLPPSAGGLAGRAIVPKSCP